MTQRNPNRPAKAPENPNRPPAKPVTPPHEGAKGPKASPLRLRSTDRIAITGQPGTGKTTLNRYLATLVGDDSLMIYDPLNQYREFPDRCRRVPEDRNPRQEFDQFSATLMARGNVTALVEEAQRYLPQNGKLGDNTLSLLNRGRNYGVGIWASTQRIQGITKDFFDLAQLCIFFRCGLTSRGYIRDLVPRLVAARIERLPDHHFIHYNLHTEEWGVATLELPRAARLGQAGAVPKGAHVVGVNPSDMPEDRGGDD